MPRVSRFVRSVVLLFRLRIGRSVDRLALLCSLQKLRRDWEAAEPRRGKCEAQSFSFEGADCGCSWGPSNMGDGVGWWDGGGANKHRSPLSR